MYTHLRPHQSNQNHAAKISDSLREVQDILTVHGMKERRTSQSVHTFKARFPVMAENTCRQFLPQKFLHSEKYGSG